MANLQYSIRQRGSSLLEKYFSGSSISYRQVIAIIIPILVDQAFVSCINIINTAMISSSGVSAISAVNMVDSLNVFLINVFIAIATGGTVVVAQYKGSGNMEMVSESGTQAISAVTVTALAISVLMIIFHNTILTLLFGGAEQEVFANAKVYLIGSCASYTFLAGMQAVCGVLRGVGDTRATLMLSLIMNLIYVLLNVLFVSVLKMGVSGLIISMITARVIGMLCAIVYMLKITQTFQFDLKKLLKFNFSIQKKILFVGIPFAMEQLFFNGGKLLTQTFIVQLGTYAITINAISGSIMMLLQIVGNALSLAIVTVVGQCMGRNDVADARKFIRSFLWLISVTFVLSAVLILPLFPYIVRIYSPPAEIIPEIFKILLVTSIAQPFLWATSFVTPSALRAAGDSKFTSISSMLSMWLFRVILGYLLGIPFGWGILGVWVAMIIEWGIRSTVFLLRLRGTKWCSHRLID